MLAENYKDSLRNSIFKNKEERFNRLNELHNRKLDLLTLRNSLTSSVPYIVEVTGTPRSGKTNTVNNVKDFFKKGGFRVEFLEEPAHQINTMIKNQSDLKSFNDLEFNHLTLKKAVDSLKAVNIDDFDIIFMDRGILDNYVWYDVFYQKGEISDEQHRQYFEEDLVKYRELIDVLSIMYINENVALERDYLNSITLEPRRKITLERLKEFNQSLLGLIPRFTTIANSVNFMDTADISIVDSSILLAEDVINGYAHKLELVKK